MEAEAPRSSGYRAVHDGGGSHPFPRLVRAGESNGRRGRLLLVSYHFAPARTAGALRWQKLAPYLIRAGWDLDVVAADPCELELLDDESLRALPREVSVYGVRSPAIVEDSMLGPALSRTKAAKHVVAAPARWVSNGRRHHDASAPDEPLVSQKGSRAASVPAADIKWDALSVRDWRRAYSAWLHARRSAGWARVAERAVLSLWDPEKHRLLISSGPPHSAHIAASAVARRVDAPLMMDYRDPWSFKRRLPEDYASPLFFWIAERREKRAIDAADTILTTTEPLRRALVEERGLARQAVVTVLNGFDREDPPPHSRASDAFSLAYAGNLYLDRDPAPLLRAFARFAARMRLSPTDVSVKFVGETQKFGGTPLTTIADECGVGAYIEIRESLPRSALRKYLSDVSLLVNLHQDSRWAIPSKIFEYMTFDAWMLVLARTESPVAELLRDTPANVVSPDDEEAIAAVLEQLYRRYRAGERPSREDWPRRFSRDHQAELLVDAIENTLAREPDRGDSVATVPTLDHAERSSA